MKAKKKGFTLVELLAAITILGIIAIIALPQVGKIATENKKKKYEKYGESLITATKLYTDSYLKDMFGNNEVGCIDITLENLLSKGLGSDIKIDGETCENSDTFIRVSKNKDNYKYSYSMVCTKDSGATTTYTDTSLGALGICQGIGDDKGPEIEVVTNDKLTQIVDRDEWTIGGKSDEFVEVKISDRSGLSENTKIKYAWSTNSDSASIQETDYIEYNFENKRNQGIKTEPPEDSTPISLKIGIPKNITGQYYLHVIPVQVYDSLGNTYIEPEGGLTKPMINIDNSKPICQNNTEGITWITSKKGEDVEVGCNDEHSGCKKNKFTKKITNLKVGDKAIITIEDEVGNKTECELEVQVDTTPPTCSVSGNTSWTNQAVTLIGSCSDKESGCVKESINKKFTEETNSKQSPGKVCDKAGNCTECATKTVQIDKTAPTCTVSGGSTSWTNTSRTIKATCKDSGGSGCKEEIISHKYATEMNITNAGAAGVNNGGIIEDKAGNKTTCIANQTVKIDKTKPICSVSGGNSQWINKNSSEKGRTITATCTDSGGSGCKRPTITKTYTSDINTTEAGVEGNRKGGMVEDEAGNKGTCLANQTIKIDKTPPTCSVSGGNSNWTNSTRTITARCSDNTSGCQTGSFQKVYNTEINTTKAGANGNNNGGTIRDKAGNETSCKADQTVKIDKTPPTCSVSGGGTSWVSSRTITASCSDRGGSGCANSSFSKTYNTSIKTTTAGANGNNSGGSVRDNAGNSASCPANQTVNIDKTNPTTPTISLSHTSETAENVTFTITPGTDSQSGVNKTEYKIGNGSWTKYNGNRITLLSNTGVQEVSARTIDYAGNTSNTTSKTGKCDKDAVTVNRKDNKAGGFRLTLSLKYSPIGITSNKYEYAYWKIESTNDTSNNQSGQVESKCGNKPPSSATKKTTTNGYTDYIPQKYSRQYYCFAVRPYRSEKISELNRWTVQRKHAQGATG